jgi:hypothetical protein
MGYIAEAAEAIACGIQPSSETKIVLLSLPKTGTTSFKAYLEADGLKVAGAGPTSGISGSMNRMQFERFVIACHMRLTDCDGFQEWPWCFWAKLFVELFPNTKFVTFTRPFDDWWKSYRNHLADRDQAQKVVEQFVGQNADEDAYRRFYDQHYADCAAITAGRPSIVIDLYEPDDAKRDKLNHFLGLNVTAFGHELKHEKRLLFQVRRALGQHIGPEARIDARAILAHYRRIYGDDQASRRAEALIQGGNPAKS